MWATRSGQASPVGFAWRAFFLSLLWKKPGYRLLGWDRPKLPVKPKIIDQLQALEM